MHSVHSFTLAAGLVAAVTAVSAAQAPRATPPSNADTDFVQKAATAGKMEVAHGKLAASKASNAQVKAFGQTLVKDHTAANQQLMALAKRKNITIADHPAAASEGRGVSSADTTTAATKAGGKPSPTGTTGTTGASGGVATTGEARDREAGKGGAHQTEPWMSATGAAFDRGFVEAQVKAHQEAISLFEQQAKNGSDADIKAFAQKQLPGLRNHLKQAQDLQGKLRTTE